MEGGEEAWLRNVLALKRGRRRRQREGVCFVEGVRAIDRLRARGHRIRNVLYDAHAVRSAWAEALVASSSADARVPLPARAMRALSDREEASEVLVLAVLPDEPEIPVPARAGEVVIVLDRPARPGNLGAILRSADALGARGVLVLGHACDPWDPAAIRASAGSVFSLPVQRLAGPEALDAWRGESATRFVGTSARADLELAHALDGGPLVLAFGSERDGLSRALRERVDALACIPQLGDATSLNLASAVAVALYEAGRGRDTLPDGGRG